MNHEDEPNMSPTRPPCLPTLIILQPTILQPRTPKRRTKNSQTKNENNREKPATKEDQEDPMPSNVPNENLPQRSVILPFLPFLGVCQLWVEGRSFVCARRGVGGRVVWFFVRGWWSETRRLLIMTKTQLGDRPYCEIIDCDNTSLRFCDCDFESLKVAELPS